MNRRKFLARLGAAAAAPLVINAELLEFPAIPTKDERMGAFLEKMNAPLARFGDKVFKQIRAHKDIKAGEAVCVQDGQLLGVATRDIANGCVAYIQVGGPVAVKVAWR